MPTHLVFVYGTLKTSGKLHPHMYSADAVKVNEGYVEGYALYDLGSYPCVMPSPGVAKVYGELYTVPEQGIHRLDKVEGVPYLYQRENARFVSTQDRSSDPIDVEIYVWLRDLPSDARVIETGRY